MLLNDRFLRKFNQNGKHLKPCQHKLLLIPFTCLLISCILWEQGDQILGNAKQLTFVLNDKDVLLAIFRKGLFEFPSLVSFQGLFPLANLFHEFWAGCLPFDFVSNCFETLLNRLDCVSDPLRQTLSPPESVPFDTLTFRWNLFCTFCLTFSKFALVTTPILTWIAACIRVSFIFATVPPLGWFGRCSRLWLFVLRILLLTLFEGRLQVFNRTGHKFFEQHEEEHLNFNLCPFVALIIYNLLFVFYPNHSKKGSVKIKDTLGKINIFTYWQRLEWHYFLCVSFQVLQNVLLSF